jgi:tetratricopeptide (TPR) repeat protein/O-antigen ligase
MLMAMLKQTNKNVVSANESFFDIAIEMLLLSLIFLAPVVFDRRVGIVFSLTKVTVIRMLIIAILTTWATKILVKQEHRFIRTPMDYPVLSYFLACTIATLTSIHVLVSFMGFYGRYEGLSTLYVYCLVFFITTNFIKTRDQIYRILYTIIISGVCMSVYGVIQRYHLDPYAWGGVVTWQRVIGTIGQPNFLAAYVDMAFIIGLALLINIKDIAKSDKWDIINSIIYKVALIFSLFLIYVCIIFTQSRGGFLGLLAGIAFFFLLTKRELVISKWKEFLILLIMILTCSVVTMLNPEVSFLGRVTGEVEKVEEINTQETPIITYSAALSRIETWKSAYRVIADYPLFGIGQEVLKMVFPRYETDKFRFYEGFHVKQDRCHNEVCDMSVTRGVITFAVYVWILGTFFYMGTKLIRTQGYDQDLKVIAAGCMAAAVAYFVQNQFSFGVVAITTLVWIMMGITASIYIRPQPNPPAKQIDMTNIPWLAIAGVLVIAVSLAFLSVVQFRADIYFKNAKSLADYRSFDQAEGQFISSLKVSPYEGQTWTHYGITLLNLSQIRTDKSYAEKGIEMFNIGTLVDPYNADNFYIGGRAYLMLSLFGVNTDDKVLEYERKALKVDPLYAEAYQIMGAIYEKQGKLQQASDCYEKTLEINPQIAEAVSGLSNISIKKGDPNLVINILKKFLDKYPNNPVFQENLAVAYIRRNNPSAATRIYEDMIKTNPRNYRALVNLGFLYGQMDNIARAKELFESAVMVDPKSVDAHNGLGMVYIRLNRPDRAKEEFGQSLMVDPNNEYANKMIRTIK